MDPYGIFGKKFFDKIRPFDNADAAAAEVRFEAELEEAKPAIRLLGGKCERCESYTIPGTDVTHSALIIRKNSPTPSKYPRRFAQIKKSPLV